MVSMGQIDNICGFGSVANAAAVGSQVAQGRVPTCAETRNLAEGYIAHDLQALIDTVVSCSPDGYAQDKDITDAANLLGLNDDVFEIFYSAEANSGLQEKIANNEVVHVVRNVGGAHWVIVSV